MSYARQLLESGRNRAKAGALEAALADFQQAATLQPDLAEAWFFAGVTLSQLQRDADAVAPLRRALALAPRQVEILGTLAYTEFRLNHFTGAASLLQELCRQRPGDLDAHLKLGEAWNRLGRPELAAEVYRGATAQHPDDGGLWMSLAQAEDEAGDREAAAAAYERAIALRPGWIVPLAGLLSLRRGKAGAAHIEAAKAALAAPALGDAGRAILAYALGKVQDGRGEFAAAMASWQAANAARRRVAAPLDREALARQVADTVAAFPGAPPADGVDDPRPVFVVGMPRSGTTLVEQIIATHPQAAGCGELPTLPAIAARHPRIDPAREAAHYLAVAAQRGSADALRLVDKLPMNFFHLGVAARLFPRAHVVWCRRDPRDVALSNYSENMSLQFAFSTDLDDIARYDAAHETLMRHWQSVLPLPILEVGYEALVSDLEPQARRLIEFLDLDWDPACLEFHASKRAVQTPSRWQVREPVHTGSVGRWQNYRQWLD